MSLEFAEFGVLVPANRMLANPTTEECDEG